MDGGIGLWFGLVNFWFVLGWGEREFGIVGGVGNVFFLVVFLIFYRGWRLLLGV